MIEYIDQSPQQTQSNEKNQQKRSILALKSIVVF